MSEVEGAFLWKRALLQTCLDKRQTNRTRVNAGQSFLRVLAQRLALEQVLQLTLLLCNRQDPTSRSFAWLIMPFQKVRHEIGESAPDFALVSFCHIGEKLAEVLDIDLVEPALLYQFGHLFQP